MGEVYKKPPAVEALCEFHFDPGSPWDVTVFGHYYDRIGREFSEKRQMPQVTMSMQQRENGVAGEFREAGVRMQFARPDRTALVQLAPHLLVINKLPPYESWGAFRALILACLEEYLAVAGRPPIQRIELRYINRIDFPAAGFTVGDSFGPSEFMPVRLRQAGAPFFLRLEMPGEDQETLTLTMGLVDSQQTDRLAVLLDLSTITLAMGALDAATLPAQLDKAHNKIEEAFESCLTEALRRQFRGEG
jgi:uncharacterized protein (TIGR04255 family)